MNARCKKPIFCMVVHQDYFIDARVMQYAETLAQAGYGVDVICARASSGGQGHAPENIRVFSIPFTHRQGSFSALQVEYILAMPMYAAYLLWLFLQNRYTVIHVHNMPDFLIFCALIPKLLGAKLILDIHDPMPEIFTSKYKKPQKNILLHLVCLQEKASTALADAVITANPNFKRALQERGVEAEKITVVLNQPDPKVFQRGRCQREKREQGEKMFRLIYPGTIAPRYGLDIAVRALPLLIEKIPHIRLVLIGSVTDYARELTQLAVMLGVTPHVVIKPAIPLEQIPAELCSADVGIYPALPDEHMSIAIPGKIVEYVVMGLPVVASRLKILEQIFPDEAIIFFEPGNVEQFARCVLGLYQNPQYRDEIVRHADESYTEKHSWENEKENYFEVLNQFNISFVEENR